MPFPGLFEGPKANNSLNEFRSIIGLIISLANKAFISDAKIKSLPFLK